MDVEISKSALNAIFTVSLTMITALVRIVYENKERKWQRKLLETILCGLISVGFYSLSSFLNLNPMINVFVGSCIGLLGVDYIKVTAHKFISNRVNKK